MILYTRKYGDTGNFPGVSTISLPLLIMDIDPYQQIPDFNVLI